MKRIHAKHAYYIKLGTQGEYEVECLKNPGIARVGWVDIPPDMINGNPDQIDWDAIKLILNKIYVNKGTATNQTNQLRTFCSTDSEALWITFYSDHLYWCFLNQTIETLDDNTKIRRTEHGWYHTDIHGTHLHNSHLSGSLLSTKSYRGTICKVKELSYLLKKINGETSPEEDRVEKAQTELIESLQAIIHRLHWKEFELLVDLIFRQTGWQRIGELGSNQKSIDLELLSPITNERIRVQVKSTADHADFQKFEQDALNHSASLNIFVVHNPNTNLKNAAKDSLVPTWFVEDIARLVVKFGLIDWLIAKAK